MVYARTARTSHATSLIRLARSLRAAGTGLILGLLRSQELAQQRRQLLAMDDRMLKDLGLSRTDAVMEGQRPFWDDRGVEWRPWR